MTDIDPSQFYSGGFFLIRAVETPQGLDESGLLPEKIISLSNCFCVKFDIHWNGKVMNSDSMIEFGVSKPKQEQFEKWCDDNWFKQFEIGGMFNSIEYAQNFVAEFIPDTRDLYLIEVGLPVYFMTQNLRETTPDNNSEVSINKRISDRTPLSQNGISLGFEIVGSEPYGFSHSWLCSYIHRDMHDLYGIKPNQYGFIDTFDDAKKVYDWIAEDEMKGTRAEPIPYDFWLIISHPLKEETENPPSK